MGILQKKCRTTEKKLLAYRGKGGQNADTASHALRSGVVLCLPSNFFGAVNHMPKISHANFAPISHKILRPENVFLFFSGKFCTGSVQTGSE